MKELYRFRQFLKEAYNLPDLDSNTSKYVNNHWDGILKDILRAHTDLRNSKGGESIPERPSQIDIDAVLDKFSDADDYIDVDPNVYDEDYFDFYDMYIVTQRRDESTKNISDEDYPKGNYDGYTKRDDLDKLSDLAEGRLLKEIGFNLMTPQNAELFVDYARKLGYKDIEVDRQFVDINDLFNNSDNYPKLSKYSDKLRNGGSSGSQFRDERPSDTITLAVDKAYYNDDRGEFTLIPTDTVVTADNFEDIIFDEVGDEEVDFASYVSTYPEIFKKI